MDRYDELDGDTPSRVLRTGRELAGRVGLPLAAVLSVVAGLVHLWVLPSHAAEDRLLGIAFGLTAVVQLGFGAVLPFRPRPGVLLFGIASNTAVLMAYAKSRLDGLPFGSHAGTPEAIGAIDVTAAMAEGLLIALLIVLRASDPVRPRAFRGRATRFATVPVLLGTMVLTSASWAADDAAVHAHEENEERTSRPVAAAMTADHEAPMLPEVPLQIAAPDPAPEEIVPVEQTSRFEAATCQAGSNPAALVAWAEESDLYTYDDGSGDRTRVIDRKPEDWLSQVSFRSSTTVTFVIHQTITEATEETDGRYQTVLRQVDLQTRERTDILRLDAGIATYAWDPCGRYVVWTDWDGGTGTEIRILDTVTGETSSLRRTEDIVNGRCGGAGDEVALRWSPDGRHIALVMTPFDNDRTLQVFGLDGELVVPPLPATFPRWKDAATLVYRTSDGSGLWYKLNIETGARSRILARAGTYNVDLSPDGTRAVYQDMHGMLYAYTFLTGEERKVGNLLGSARWIDGDTVLAANLKDCGGECHDDFETDGSTRWIDVDSGETRPAPMAYLYEIDVLYATSS